MYGIGKVNGRGAGGQIDDVALGREYEHLIGKHVYLQIVEKVGGVGVLLAFQQTADPGVALLVAGFHGGVAHFVFPVGGNAVLRGAVHLPGAYLHLKGDTLRADDRGVHGLIHIGLGGGDIVLEAAGHGLIHVVDYAQHVIAVGDGIHNDPEGAQVENAVQIQLLGVHFAVDAVYMLYPAINRGVEVFLRQPVLYLFLHLGHEFFQHGHFCVQHAGDLLVARRVKV